MRLNGEQMETFAEVISVIIHRQHLNDVRKIRQLWRMKINFFWIGEKPLETILNCFYKTLISLNGEQIENFAEVFCFSDVSSEKKSPEISHVSPLELHRDLNTVSNCFLICQNTKVSVKSQKSQ